MNDRKSRSLGEMAADAGESLWACPRCGCMDWRTVNSYFAPTDQTRHRRQRCRGCGYMRMTWETTIPPQQVEEKCTDNATNGKGGAVSLTIPMTSAKYSQHDAADDSSRSNRKRSTRAKARSG